MIKLKRIYGGAFIIAALLTGCNGSSNEVGDSGSQENKQMPPIASSFVKRITSNYQNNLDFSDYIYDEDIEHVEVTTNVESGSCKFENVNGLKTKVTSSNDGLCIFNYKVTNAHGLSSTQNASVIAASTIGVIQYPVLTNYSATANSDLTIDVFSDLIAKDPTLDMSDKIIDEVFTVGVGNSTIDIDGKKIVFIGSDFGVSSILFTVKNKSDSELAGYGRIDIAVSSSFNSQPQAKQVLFDKVLEPGVEYSVELDSFTPPIISDPDMDDLQLVDLKAYEGSLMVKPSDALNLFNKRFYVKFPLSSSNIHDVSYTVSDHKGGYATNIIRFKVKSPLDSYWHDIIYKDYKRFTAPLTKELMALQYPSITESFTEDDIVAGDKIEVSIADIDTARSFCTSKGSRLPRYDEFDNLYKLKGNLYTSDNWPHKLHYWLSDGTAFDINTGSVVSSSPSKSYITCVKGGIETYTKVIDNSIVGTGISNQIDFFLKDIYGAPLVRELVNFNAQGSSEISFSSTSAATTSKGMVSAEFIANNEGVYNIAANYIDDELVSDTSFAKLNIISTVINPSEITLIKDNSANLSFIGKLADNSIVDLTGIPTVSWESSDDRFVTVDDKGRITAIETTVAPITITATLNDGSGLSAKSVISVVKADVVSISLLLGAKDHLVEDNTRQLIRVMAELSDGSTSVDVTSDPRLVWSIDDSSLADFTDPTKGELKGIHYGTATVTVEGRFLGGITASDSITFDILPYYTDPVYNPSGREFIYTDSDGFIVDEADAVFTYSVDSEEVGESLCMALGLRLPQDPEHLREYLRERMPRDVSNSFAHGLLGEHWPKSKIYWSSMGDGGVWGDIYSVGFEDSVNDYISSATPADAHGVILCEND
ncbi:Ig-like domain-containing protein [Photobacterium damselae]